MAMVQENEANAHLNSASHELLKLAEMVKSLADRNQLPNTFTARLVKEKAVAAIAKARGVSEESIRN